MPPCRGARCALFVVRRTPFASLLRSVPHEWLSERLNAFQLLCRAHTVCVHALIATIRSPTCYANHSLRCAVWGSCARDARALRAHPRAWVCGVWVCMHCAGSRSVCWVVLGCRGWGVLIYGDSDCSSQNPGSDDAVFVGLGSLT